jgi:hypothetical protein
VYAAGLDHDKAEKTLKDALTKTSTAAPPRQAFTFALKPFGELLLKRVLPLVELADHASAESDPEGVEIMRSMFTKLSAVDARAKVAVTTEFPNDGYRQNFRMDGRCIDAIFETVMQPAITASRESAQRAAQPVKCSNNMRSIVLAFHDYHDTHNALPPLYTVDENGKPLHSWRVLILPYIEQQQLYWQIKFDEPWDSEHNKQFHHLVIPTYACSDNTLAKPGAACTYSVIAGERPGRVFSDDDGNPISTRTGFTPAAKARETFSENFGTIADGLSNTLALVEVKQPFCWMDPTADVTLDELAKGINKPDGRLGSPHEKGMNVVLFDCVFRFVLETTDPKILRAMAGVNDGRKVMLP